MNPESNRFEPIVAALNKLHEIDPGDEVPKLLRPDGTPVPDHWSVFTVGENVVVKNYTFKVAYIGESTLLLEPVGPVLVGGKE